MKPTQAIKNAIDGNAILFIGSGFSVGAQNVLSLDFLSGTALSNNLCEELNIKEEMQLDIASDIYLEEKGEHNLITKLNNIYYAKKVTESQKTICSLPWKRIYTTNYDNVIELSSSLVSKRVSPVTINEDPSQHIGLKNICVHINGFIDQLTPSTLKNSFKLTTSSYMTDEFTNSKWGAVFRQDLNLAKAVILPSPSRHKLQLKPLSLKQRYQ